MITEKDGNWKCITITIIHYILTYIKYVNIVILFHNITVLLYFRSNECNLKWRLYPVFKTIEWYEKSLKVISIKECQMSLGIVGMSFYGVSL